MFFDYFECHRSSFAIPFLSFEALDCWHLETLLELQMNGLKLTNSWAGYAVLLNPPYTAASQWRFVNRAIDEVENDRVQSAPTLSPSLTAFHMHFSVFIRLCIAVDVPHHRFLS